MEKIKINLSSDSIKDAISKLNEYKSSLNQRLDSAMEEIASSGAEKASSLWDSLPFTPTHTKPTFSYEKICSNEASSCTIIHSKNLLATLLRPSGTRSINCLHR